MEIVNRVEKSGLISIDPAEWVAEIEMAVFDLVDFLEQGLVLREKSFRSDLKSLDWSQFNGKHVALHCSSDAIIPLWAWMLATTYLSPIAKSVIRGSKTDLQRAHLQNVIDAIDTDRYRDAKMVIKGCADIADPEYFFTALTLKLQPVVKTLMFGEPCSTVPVYKRRKA